MIPTLFDKKKKVSRIEAQQIKNEGQVKSQETCQSDSPECNVQCLDEALSPTLPPPEEYYSLPPPDETLDPIPPPVEEPQSLATPDKELDIFYPQIKRESYI